MTVPAEGTVEVRRSVEVPLSVEAAFDLFTGRIKDFWPTEHSIGAAPFVDIVIEPRAGGRWYERAADGAECQWGGVVDWNPPHSLTLAWQISATWEYDPELHTLVDVAFTPAGRDATRVELRHHGLENYGERAEEMRALFATPEGWTGTLTRFAAFTRGELA
jgi:hypothetical protein